MNQAPGYSIYTTNAICGLIRKRQTVKELIAPYGDAANKEITKELIREFCIENQWAYGPDVCIPADSSYFIDWDAVTTIARVIAESE